MKTYFSIQIENSFSEIEKVSDKIQETGDSLFINPGIINSLILSLDELLTNVISYGYNDKNTHSIEVSFFKENDYICVRIIDDAIEFNPLKRDEVDIDKSIDEKQIGGLGIHLVKKLMDDIEYKRIDGKNILTLKKEFK